MHNNNLTSSVLALDVGEKRIGVAVAQLSSMLPRPLKTVRHTDQILHDLVALVHEQRAVAVVIGLPRGLEGQETPQTKRVEMFGRELEQHLSIPIYWQDEAVTSKQAEAELVARGKPYDKGDIDSLAATYILEDFLHNHREVLV